MSKIGNFTQILMIRPQQAPLLAQRFSQKRKFNYEFYKNKFKIFYSRVLKDIFIVKNVLVGAFYFVLNDVLMHFFLLSFGNLKKPCFSVT
jgi:hypothetical protein